MASIGTDDESFETSIQELSVKPYILDMQKSKQGEYVCVMW